IDRLLELYPWLHQRVSVLLAERLKTVVRSGYGAKTRPGEIVVLEGWTSGADRRPFVEALAAAAETELGRAGSSVSVTSGARSAAGAARPDRPDAIVAAKARTGGGLRERVAAELASRATQAPVVLVEIDDDVAGIDGGLAQLADAMLLRVGGRRPA